ncbi:MAG: amino acid adenylation domain-containing protein, partial [Acidobacteriota bacterium]
MVFTSGSTGRPKPVGVEHRNLALYVDAAREGLALPRGASFALVSTLAADLGYTSVFGALAGDGVLHVVPEDLSTDPEALASLVRRERIDCMKIVPSHLGALLTAQGASDLLPARRLILGGEAALPELVERVFALAGARPGVPMLLNHYGPTETTVGAVAGEIKPGPAPAAGHPPGRPLPGVAARVVDARLRPAPAGVPGELVIRGGTLGQGYPGRPAETARSFVPDSFGGVLGARLYRTGDLARFGVDGRLTFLGRIDHQVKVRGVRIELGEIERALLNLSEVAEAAVLPIGEGSACRLVGYVVVSDGERATAEELRGHLEGALPPAMVPAAWVFLDVLPLTPNGKLDRRALPVPMVSAEIAYVPPSTPTEEIVAAVWSEVLKVESVGANGDFFALGGHSLLATQVVSRLRSVFGVELSLRELFRSPTVSGLARAVDRLRNESDDGPEVPLVPRPPKERLRPSFAQERLWFLERLEGGSSAYVLPYHAHLEGPLDRRSLALALEHLERRHAELRATFEEVDGIPRRRIRSATGRGCGFVDLRRLAPGRADSEARLIARREARRSFDLTRGPLLRIQLVIRGEEEHDLLLTLHHIVSDAWSRSILVRDLQTLYSVYREGSALDLEPPPIEFADFAAWQRECLQGPRLKRLLGYWRGRLADGSPALALPLDRPRPTRGTGRGEVRVRLLPPVVTGSLTALGQRLGATRFMVALSAFQAFLYRISGQEDFAVGTPVAGRLRQELEGVVGMFVNTLVLRSRVGGDPSFAALLGRVRETVLEAHAHQELPFERLVEALQPERTLSRTPLFQVALVVQNVPQPALAFGEARGRPSTSHNGSAKFDLTMTLTEKGEGIELAIEYASDLFDPTTAERLLRTYGRLLETVAREPEARVSTLPLLSAAERHQLVHAWNAGEPEPEPEGSALPLLHELVERQVSRRRDATAVRLGSSFLSYGELDRRATTLAHRLVALGVGPEVVVALFLDRSVEVVIAMLGILKAGGAYLPVDPVYPEDRLAYMLEDSGATVVLTESARLSILRSAAPASVRAVLAVDSVPVGPAGASRRPVSHVGPGQLAYVIYTSGSTGHPKGTLVSHGNVVRLFDRTQGWYGFGVTDTWTLFHSHSFDFSVWEIWGALVYGGSLVVVPHLDSRTPERVLELLAAARVTVLNQTPSAFGQLVELVGRSPAPELALRWVIFGGEALEPAQLAPWWDRYGARRPRLVNMYGITETTVHVTFRPMALDDLDAPSGSPIGRPVPDLSHFVLDPRGEPVPFGVPGELRVGGPGLARGYLGRAALTAERFVPNPFGEAVGERLYRSGDLVRRLPDGELDYLGRTDHQVQVRGFRIELGEIVHKLSGHPEVGRAVVTLRRQRPGDDRLVAYWTPAASGAVGPDRSELRAQLRRHLPAYMIPAFFVRLEELPLTPNGKVDRKALPEPLADPGAGGRPPAPGTEAEVAGIFGDLLGVSEIGADDDFFELGGHSLLATRAVARLREALGVELPIRDLFECPTPEGLARRIEAAARAEKGTRERRPVPIVRSGPLPLSFGQEQLWFL